MFVSLFNFSDPLNNDLLTAIHLSMIQVTTLLTLIQHLTMIECICECDQDLLPATMELPWAEAASTTETSVTILAPSLLSISVVTGNRVNRDRIWNYVSISASRNLSIILVHLLIHWHCFRLKPGQIHTDALIQTDLLTH